MNNTTKTEIATKVFNQMTAKEVMDEWEKNADMTRAEQLDLMRNGDGRCDTEDLVADLIDMEIEEDDLADVVVLVQELLDAEIAKGN